MPRGAKIVFWVCGIWFLTTAAAAFLHSASFRLFAMVPTLAFIAGCITSIVWGFTYAWPLGIRAGIPLLVCICTAALAALVAPVLFGAGFGRVVPGYAAVVRQMESSQITVGSKPTRITLPTELEHLAYAVWATRATNGDLTVTFFVGGSFPVRHWGYLYSSSGDIEVGSLEDRRWPKRSRLKDKWFYIAD